AGLHAFGDGADEMPDGGFTPEPSMQLRLGDARALGHAGFVVEGLEIVYTVTQELRHRHAGGPLLDVGLFPAAARLEKADHATPASLWNATQPDGGAAIMFLHPPLIMRPQHRHFVGRIAVDVRGRLCDGRGLDE